MDKCVMCGADGCVEILERGIPETMGPDGLPTYVELKGICLMCGAESRWFLAHKDDAGNIADVAKKYLSQDFTERFTETIPILVCRCGGKPVEFVEDISYHGWPNFKHRVRCPMCGHHTSECNYQIQAQYEWNRWVRTKVAGPVKELSRDDKLAFIINSLRGEVLSLREQVRFCKEAVSDHFIGYAFDEE